jgi:glycosyltransferase involved in cell wall biosynthesis
MKVCHLIYSMGGGGAERQLSYLAGGLVKLGVDTTVVHVRGGPNYRRLCDSGARVVRLRDELGYGGVFLQFLKIVGSDQPDIVHTWLTNMDIVGGAASLLARRRFIISERCNRFGGYPVRLAHVHRSLARRARAVVANSRSGLDFWQGSVPPSTLLEHVPNSLPIAEIDSIDPSSGRAVMMHKDRRWVLFAGRLTAGHKNIGTLAKAWTILAERDPSLGFVVAGAGPDARILEDIKSRLGNRLIHLDYVPERELWAMMKRASVLISCSRFEGSPNVVIEAMACRCPLVVSSIDAHREILSADSAALAGMNEVDDYVNATLDVLARPAATQARVAAARQVAEGFRLEQTAQAYLRIYQQVQAQPAS